MEPEQARPLLLLDLEDDVLMLLAYVVTQDRLPLKHIRRYSKAVWVPETISVVANLMALSMTCKSMHSLLQPQLQAMQEKLLEKLRARSPAQKELSDRSLLLWSSALLECKLLQQHIVKPPISLSPSPARRRASLPEMSERERDEMVTQAADGLRRQYGIYRTPRMLHNRQSRRLSLPLPPARAFNGDL